MALSETAARMEWGACWLEPAPIPRALATEVRRSTGGGLPVWASRLAPLPWLARAFARLTEKRLAHMPLALWDLIGLIVSQDNSCRYCYGAMRTVLKVLGHDDAYVDRIERDVHLAELSRTEQAALEFARRVSHANPRPAAGELEDLARAGFSRPAIAEIAYAAASSVFANRVATLLALPPEPFEGWVDRPLARLLRPLVARRLRARRVAPEPLPRPNDGPCAAVVAALAGSPVARVLREVIDDALASPVLPRRTKLLMLAVIGRALGCRPSEVEAAEGLRGAGFTPDDVSEVLANLGSPKLDGREVLLVPFARETVRYRNAAIQRHTHELWERLGTQEVLEAIGIAALANGVCRLSVLLEAC